MKSLIICDDCKVASIAPFCAANNWGIEVQSFYDPDFITRNPDAIGTHVKPLRKLNCVHCTALMGICVQEVLILWSEMWHETGSKWPTTLL